MAFATWDQLNLPKLVYNENGPRNQIPDLHIEDVQRDFIVYCKSPLVLVMHDSSVTGIQVSSWPVGLTKLFLGDARVVLAERAGEFVVAICSQSVSEATWVTRRCYGLYEYYYINVYMIVGKKIGTTLFFCCKRVCLYKVVVGSRKWQVQKQVSVLAKYVDDWLTHVKVSWP